MKLCPQRQPLCHEIVDKSCHSPLTTFNWIVFNWQIYHLWHIWPMKYRFCHSQIKLIPCLTVKGILHQNKCYFKPLSQITYSICGLVCPRTYTQNNIWMLTDFLNISICICQNSSVARRQSPGEDVREGCSVQATHQTGCSFQIFWGIAGAFSSTYRESFEFFNVWDSKFAPPFWKRLHRRHCIPDPISTHNIGCEAMFYCCWMIPFTSAL